METQLKKRKFIRENESKKIYVVRFWREINNLDRTYNQDFQTVITFQYFFMF